MKGRALRPAFFSPQWVSRMASEFAYGDGSVVGLILAAGRGSRFGGDKLLQPLPDGTPIGLRSAINLNHALGAVFAIVRHDDIPLRRLFEGAGITCIVCESAADGMGATIACGVRATCRAAGWVIALGDMPYINSRTIRAVGDAIAAGAGIAAPRVNGIRGHPVGFSAAYRDSLHALTGDAGARSVLAANLDQLTTIDCDDYGILADIDTPCDLTRVNASAPYFNPIWPIAQDAE